MTGIVKTNLDKKIELDEFITHNKTLDKVNDAFELMKHSKVVSFSYLIQLSVDVFKVLVTFYSFFLFVRLFVCLFCNIWVVMSVSPK